MRWLPGVTAFVGLLPGAACRNRAADTPPGPRPEEPDPRRLVGAAGGFSYVPPEGWTVEGDPGKKYKSVTGPTEDRFAANIVVRDVTFPGTLDELVEGGLAATAKQFDGLRPVSREEFRTAAGMRAVRFRIEHVRNGRRVRQTIYTFGPAGTQHVLITCSTAAAVGDALDPVFEACMKTFRFDQP